MDSFFYLLYQGIEFLFISIKKSRKMKRTFIAVPVPVEEPLRKLLGELRHTFREDKIKWIEPENLHLTLFFFGDTDEEIIPSVSSALVRSTSNFNEFKLDF
ncbi:unnamed protein product, partial [marine sediment metagenome]